MFEFQVRPIDKWPRAFTKNRKRGTFTNQYGVVMKDIQRELGYLAARNSVLLMDLRDDEIRNDGRPRANARPGHPGVVLVVELGKGGSLRFPCDRYDDWVSNIRAITLHLQALRAIDRYGVSVSGEQYTGWKALPPPNGDHWTPDQARDFLRTIIGGRVDAQPIAAAIRECEMLTHPDRGGRAEDFHKVQQARKLLLS